VTAPARPRAAVALVLGAAAAACALALSGCSAPSHPEAAATYGSLPSYLPKSSIHPDSVLTGTTTRPALTVEGDAVNVKLAAGSGLRATVLGPVVPGEGLPYQPDSTAATFLITLTDATRSVPVSIDQFRTVDHLGNVYVMQLLPDEPALPSSVEPGQTVSFELRARMVTGEGVMQWAPDAQHPVATWDFVVEND
jgi:hypothetical protein